MEAKFAIVPLSADEIIARLRKKTKGKRPNKNISIMVRLLSAEALSADEIVKRLRVDPDYNCRGASDQKLISRLKTLGHHSILGRLDGLYFIKGALADPEIQDQLNGVNPPQNQQKGKTGQRRALRSIIYEILRKKPLAVNWLAKRVENHPAYDGSRGRGRKLVAAINSILQEKKDRKNFFERKGKKRYSIWQIKPGLNPPPKWFYQKPRPQRDALYRIMRSRAIIKGWSSYDLLEEVSRPNSSYRLNPPNSLPNSIIDALHRVIARDKKECFESVPGKGKAKRWRAKWLGENLKTPATLQDFQDLAVKVLTDLAFPLSLESLAKASRQSGHLFGYQTNELPLTFLANNISRAIAGTKYAGQIIE